MNKLEAMTTPRCSPSYPSLPAPSPSQLPSQSLFATCDLQPISTLHPSAAPFLPHPSLISTPSTNHILSSISPTQFLIPNSLLIFFFVFFSIPNLISLPTLSGSQPNLLPDSYSNLLLPFLSFTPSPSPRYPIPVPKTPPIPVRGFCGPDGGRGHCPQRPLQEGVFQGLNSHSPRPTVAPEPAMGSVL